MERTSKGAHRRCNHRIGVGEGAGGDPRTKGAGVQAVLGMEHQAAVKDPCRQGIRFPLGEHVEEIRRIGQIVSGLNRILALSN